MYHFQESLLVSEMGEWISQVTEQFWKVVFTINKIFSTLLRKIWPKTIRLSRFEIQLHIANITRNRGLKWISLLITVKKIYIVLNNIPFLLLQQNRLGRRSRECAAFGCFNTYTRLKTQLLAYIFFEISLIPLRE